MSEKLLSVSVAAYNVEGCIRQCLDSCVVPEVLDQIEVIVVNDGSIDSTQKIAEEYRERYPGSFSVINQSNGGYGTTVNASMKRATGKYFRLLDSDDWLNAEGLIEVVRHAEQSNEDWLVSDRYRYDDATGETSIVHASNTVAKGSTVALNSLRADEMVPGMWFSTFNRRLITEHPFILPGRRLYTDTIFMAHNLSHARTACYLKNPLYYYRKASTLGQSSSLESRRKHYQDHIDAYHDVLEIAEATNLSSHPALLERLRTSYSNVIFGLFLLPASSAVQKTIMNLEAELLQRCPIGYEYMAEGNRSKTMRALRSSNYSFYWLRKLLVRSR